MKCFPFRTSVCKVTSIGLSTNCANYSWISVQILISRPVFRGEATSAIVARHQQFLHTSYDLFVAQFIERSRSAYSLLYHIMDVQCLVIEEVWLTARLSARHIMGPQPKCNASLSYYTCDRNRQYRRVVPC